MGVVPDTGVQKMKHARKQLSLRAVDKAALGHARALQQAFNGVRVDEGDGDGDGGEGDGKGGDGGDGSSGDGGDGDGGGDGSGGDGGGGSDRGFPENTPVAEMTADQQAAYWKHQSRKHEDRANARRDYDELKAKAEKLEELERSQMSDQEKAVEAAKAEARTTTLQEVGARLVDAEIRAQSAGRLTDEQRTVLLEGLDRNRFLTDDGDVDTDKVTKFIDGIAPTPSGDGKGRFPADVGQGRRGGSGKPSAKEKGLEEARRRFGEPAKSS